MPRNLLVVLLLCAVSFSANLWAQDEASLSAYFAAIKSADGAIKAKKWDEASKLLASTNEKHRSFEYDYLKKCVEVKGDAIEVLSFPKDVKARYGIMHPTRPQIVFICQDGQLRIRNIGESEDKEQLVPYVQGGPIWTGVFSADGKTFASGHQNGDVVIWDVATWKQRQSLQLGNGKPVREIAVAPDGKAFAAESDKFLEYWTLATDPPSKVSNVGERLRFGEGLAFSPIGDRLASGGMFDIWIYDAATGKDLKRMRHASYTMGLEFSPNGKQIASAPRGNVNKLFAIFDIASEKQLFSSGPFRAYVAGMRFTPDGRRVIATGCEKFVQIFDTTGGETVLQISRPECSAKPGITADGKVVGWSEPAGYMYIDLR